MPQHFAARVIPPPSTAEPSICQPQPWVLDLVGPGPELGLEAPEGFFLSRRTGEGYTLVAVRLQAARYLDQEGLERKVEQAYELVLTAAGDRHLVRVWNLIPGILEPLSSLPHRYMAFNAGRFNAYSRWYGERGDFDQRVACASGIGTKGDDLIVYALAADQPGLPVVNPRQIAPYRYSGAYGPLPPCFSRATRLEETAGTPSRLLVGGTASIRGETTLHLGDLEAQIEETFHNLASVVASGLIVDLPEVHLECERQALLGRFRQLRVYYPQERDKSTIEDLVRTAFSGLEEIELLRVGLCRDGLLVEIEGWADLSTARH
ncbi:MAG: hypothetical protein WBC09_13685 [Thermoanaerobaculia bacterium]